MMRVSVVTLPEFLDRGWPYLLGEPVLNNVMLTVAHRRADREGDRWYLVTDESGAVRGAAMRTPPHGLLLAGSDREVAVALAEAQDAPVPHATGTVELVGWFTDRYRELTGVEVLGGMPSRIYRLESVVPPRAAPGHARQAGPSDRDQLIQWSRAFADEAMHGEDAGDPAEPVDARFGHDGLLWIWEDDGEPVTMTWVTRPVAGIVRISGVYTPPARRRRGYASALVAAASDYALGHFADTCMLYTDLGNPTSNRIYQEIGYRPVTDVETWRYVAP
jgi:predicted GNAT family acetyltransferase